MISKNGFTLIEILIVVAIIVIVSTTGFFSFTQFNKGRDLEASFLQLKNDLSEAKSSAISETKPTAYCAAADSLVGYRISLYTATTPDSYSLDVVCKSLTTAKESFITKKSVSLPNGLALTTSISALGSYSGIPRILFDTDGQSSNSGSITLTKGGRGKVININTNGTIYEN